MKRYKMLVLDVDGTLLNDNKEISNHTLTTLRKVQQMGVRIMLASGRPTYGLLPIAKKLELGTYNGFILSYNGGQVINASNGEVIFERRINPELIPYLEKKAVKNNFGILTYNGDAIVTNAPDNPHILAEAALNGMKIDYQENFSIAIDYPPCKCMLVSDDEPALVGLEELGAVMEMLGIKPDEIVVFGDGVADVTMLQLAELGIAMGNAPDSVKRCADYVTLSNNEDGVAVAVEKAFLADVRENEIPLDAINAQAKSTLMGNLGIQYTYASHDRIEATMPVDERNRQPFGILHGGATLALAETVAGFGSMVICNPDEFVVGMQVSGNHISSAHEGDTVRAVGTIVHKGRSSHVWNVDVFTSTGKLVSSVRVVNSVMKRK